MRDKVVVITGGTSGVGEVAAINLAAQGARIILIARDRARAEATLARLEPTEHGPGHGAYYADLSSMAEARRVAAEIAAAEPRIDVLINNAGVMLTERRASSEGFEYTFAANHMAYFVLTEGLLDRIRSAAPARIINTSSDQAMVMPLDFDDLQGAKEPYSGLSQYRRSKLCNIYFTRVLAKRLDGANVTVNAWNPGLTRTRFFADMNIFVKIFTTLAGRSQDKAAETLIFLASSPKVAAKTGGFYENCGPGKMSDAAQDDAAAERLWRITEALAQTAGPSTASAT